MKASTRRAVSRIFKRLDYSRLGRIYCDEGGDAFWRDRKRPCRILGMRAATALKSRLKPGGRSLYAGAGVAELPMLAVETLELGRGVVPLTLRRGEALILNRACAGLPFRFEARDAAKVRGTFDHIWALSVFNDPELYPELSALSYGRADPASFDPAKFARERRTVKRLVSACLGKLSTPGLVSTSVEEISWVADWCFRRRSSFFVDEKTLPTAVVGDPLCFIQVQKARRRHRR